MCGRGKFHLKRPVLLLLTWTLIVSFTALYSNGELPSDWQQARLFYNTGTSFLQEGKALAALKEFAKVDPNALLVPDFASSLFFNEAIASERYAEILSKDPYAPIEERLFYIEKGKKAFIALSKLECQEKCLAPSLVLIWNNAIEEQEKTIASESAKRQSEGKSIKEKQGSVAYLLFELIGSSEEALHNAFLAFDRSFEKKALLLDNLKALHQAVPPFLAAVIKKQALDDIDGKNGGCQNRTWDAVIALFDRGARALQAAEKQASAPLFDPLTTAAYLIQSIRSWKEALHVMLHPPSQEAQQESGTVKTAEKLQQMYLEDQSKPKESEKELHSW